MTQRVRSRLLAGALGTMTFACDGVTGPERVVGPYALAAVNGSALPAVVGTTHAYPGLPIAECRLMIADGVLQVDGEHASFAIQYTLVTSCPASESRTRNGDSGTFAQHGDSLEFRVFYGEEFVTYAGRVNGRSITVDEPNYSLRFTR